MKSTEHEIQDDSLLNGAPYNSGPQSANGNIARHNRGKWMMVGLLTLVVALAIPSPAHAGILDIFDEIFEDDTNTNSCDSETPCDTDIGADGNTREDVFEDDEEASENSDVEDEFSGMEVHESEDEERPEFRF